MRRLLKMLAACTAFILLLASCSKPAGTTPGSGGLSITASFYPMYLFTKSITKGVDGVSVKLMSQQQTGCLHDYQLTPGDMAGLSKSHVFVINGAGMESFLQNVQKNMPELKIIEASKGIALLPGGEEGPNAHVWVGVSGAIKEVQNIAGGLGAADPAHAAKYSENAQAFTAQLQALGERMKAGLAGVSNRNIVTFHEAFPYFAKEYGLNIVCEVESEPGAEPGAGEVAEYITTIRSSSVKALFVDVQYTSSTAEVIARETGLKLYPLNPVVSGPADADGTEYIRIMEENLKTLTEVLK